MAAVVIIRGGHDFIIEECCSNQPNIIRESYCCIAITFIPFMQAARRSASVIKMGVVCGRTRIEMFERRAGLGYR